jgi:hypothetical protein
VSELIRELSRSEFTALAKTLKVPAALHHGGKRNQCIGNGEHVFCCFCCDRWCCECFGSDDEKPDEPICDACWCKRNGVAS